MNWMRRLRAWEMQSGFRFISVFASLVGGYLFLWTMAIWLLASRWSDGVGGMDIILLAELSVLVGLTLVVTMWALLLWQRRSLPTLRSSSPAIERRIYGYSLDWRVVATAFATIAGCGGLWLLHWSFYLHNQVALLTVGSLGIAEGAFVAIAIMTSEAICDSDAVEIRCAIPFPRSTGRMLRSEIAAKKNFNILMTGYVLYPKEQNCSRLFIWGPRKDTYFRNWISGIPDADRQFLGKQRKPWFRI